MKVSGQVAPHVSLGVTVLAWAGAFSAIKALLDHGRSPEDIALLRYGVAAPGFALLLVRAGGLRGLRRRDWLRLGAAGPLVVAGYHVSLNVGERSTTAGTAALVVALAPALTVGISVGLGLERASWRRSLGLAAAFAGVAVVVLLGSGQELSLGDLQGPLVLLGAPLSFALYNVLLQPLLGRFGLLELTAASSLLGMLALAPFARPATATALAEMSAGDVGLVLYLGVVCTLLGYLAWNLGLRGLGATRAVAYAYAIPALGVALGALTLGEPVTVWLTAGGALILVGVALVQQRGGRGRQEALPSGRPLLDEP